MADVVAVAHIGHLQSAQAAESFLEREKIRERLAGMKAVGKCVDHRNDSIFRQLFNRFLLKDARDDSVHPALQISRHVRDGLALAQPRRGMIQKHRAAAHALHADLEGDARAQRRLLQNHAPEIVH